MACDCSTASGVNAATMPRRFPPPWSAEELGESFAIKDSTGQVLAYLSDSNNDSRRTVMNRLTRDEAQRIAGNIAKLPG